MPVKEDLRVKRTKKALSEAFVNLLKAKPLDDITINELCDAADVRRATFYKHYNDKFDFIASFTAALRDEFDREIWEKAGHMTPNAYFGVYAHEKVEFVNFAGLEGDKYYELAQKYMPNGTCGVISFGLKGTKEDAVKFMDGLKLAAIVTHVADARTCVLHPASHTHRQMNDEQLREAGVTPGMIRLSVGIENPQDIIDDLAQALAQV